MNIENSSGLSEDEIDRMVKDAETHAQEDTERRQAVESRNQLDSLVYQTEKSVSDHAESVDAETKSDVEAAIGDAKKVLEDENAEAEALNQAAAALSAASHKLAEAMYAKASEAQGPGEGGDPARA